MLGDAGGLSPRAARGLRPPMAAAARRRRRGRRGRRRRGASAGRSCSGSPWRTCPGSCDLDRGRAAPSPTSPPPRCRRRSTSPCAWSRTSRGPLATRLAGGGDGPARGRRDGLRLGRRRAVRARARHEGPTRRRRQQRRHAVVQELRRLLGAAGPDPQLGLDADLRPEGKTGRWCAAWPSYRAYYERWSLVWESQALLRAAPIAGDAELGRGSSTLIDPLRWPRRRPRRRHDVREIRRLKARMEAERLPRGADPKAHLKLGRVGSPTWSGPCSCSSCGTPTRCPRCGRPAP